MTKLALKILWCSRCNIFKVCLPFFNIMHERFKISLDHGTEFSNSNFVAVFDLQIITPKHFDSLLAV